MPSLRVMIESAPTMMDSPSTTAPRSVTGRASACWSERVAITLSPLLAQGERLAIWCRNCTCTKTWPGRVHQVPHILCSLRLSGEPVADLWSLTTSTFARYPWDVIPTGWTNVGDYDVWLTTVPTTRPR
jgi:hypothetical protein